MKIILDAHGARITNDIATFGDKSYPVKQISSYRTSSKTVSGGREFKMIIGLLLGLVGAMTISQIIIGGAIFVSLGLFMLFWAYKTKSKKIHHLFITTSGGEVEVLSSTDSDTIRNIEDGIAQAIRSA